MFLKSNPSISSTLSTILLNEKSYKSIKIKDSVLNKF